MNNECRLLITTFSITRGDPEIQASQGGIMAFVTCPISYRIALEYQRVIERPGTVTVVLARGDKDFI